ncbi:unnamed protein product [Symbiodinium sp. CCMP2592]|nr:unnamed protein product [Symbiodinium sp. CCMP2592]
MHIQNCRSSLQAPQALRPYSAQKLKSKQLSILHQVCWKGCGDAGARPGFTATTRTWMTRQMATAAAQQGARAAADRARTGFFEVQAYISENPTSLKILCFCSGLALIAFSLLGLFNPFDINIIPKDQLCNLYNVFFGVIICVCDGVLAESLWRSTRRPLPQGLLLGQPDWAVLLLLVRGHHDAPVTSGRHPGLLQPDHRDRPLRPGHVDAGQGLVRPSLLQGQLQPDGLGLRLPSVNRCSSEQSLAEDRGTMHKAAQPGCQQNVSMSLHVEEAASPCEAFLFRGLPSLVHGLQWSCRVAVHAASSDISNIQIHLSCSARCPLLAAGGLCRCYINSVPRQRL